MFTRPNAKIQVLFTTAVTVLFVCAIGYIKFNGKGERLRSTIADGISKMFVLKEVVNLQNGETRINRPYLIPSDEALSRLNETSLYLIYWRYINTLQILCRNQTRLGSFEEGGKEVCIDEIFKPKKPCIVYSFGSNFQFDFDLEAHSSFGCDVYTFDPSMDINGKGKFKPIPKQLVFKEVGLASKNHVTSQFWKMKTLKTILKENGHEKKFIDILKMDVEGAEWDSIPNIIESGAYRQVKQLLVEFHFGHFMSKPGNRFWGNMDMAKQLRVLRMLYDYGFRIFMRERQRGNYWKMQVKPYKLITPQSELSFINTAFL